MQYLSNFFNAKKTYEVWDWNIELVPLMTKGNTYILFKFFSRVISRVVFHREIHVSIVLVQSIDSVFLMLVYFGSLFIS